MYSESMIECHLLTPVNAPSMHTMSTVELASDEGMSKRKAVGVLIYQTIRIPPQNNILGSPLKCPPPYTFRLVL
jgi:hypothetical protein